MKFKVKLAQTSLSNILIEQNIYLVEMAQSQTKLWIQPFCYLSLINKLLEVIVNERTILIYRYAYKSPFKRIAFKQYMIKMFHEMYLLFYVEGNCL